MVPLRRRRRAAAAIPVRLSWSCPHQRHVLVSQCMARADATGDGPSRALLGGPVMTIATASFAPLLERFFTQRLMQQRQASPHTISSYRDTFRMLMQFTLKRLHKPPARGAFEDIDVP